MTDKKTVKKKVVNKTKAKEDVKETKAPVKNGISFKFSMRIDKEGLSGNGEIEPDRELSEEEKQHLINLVKTTLGRMNGRPAPVIRRQPKIDPAKLQAIKEFQKAFSKFQTFN